MLPSEVHETTFLAYYPDNERGQRLLVVDFMYGDIFAEGLEDGDIKTWQRFITQVERTKRMYEFKRNQDNLS